ncbi:MAG TPA: HEAT repeat domain-containing protein [Methanocorpusculum sp.]|nr:HEAT repeat domain-containing protein [Methanocorpusculum sp.]
MNDPFDDVKSADMATRRAAETAIAEMLAADHGILPVIIENIRSGDMNSRWYLSRAVVHEGPQLIPDLIAYARTETDGDVLKYLGAILASFGAPAIDPLIGLFASDNAKVRGMAAAALERIGEPAVEPLVAASRSADPMTRQCALFILQKYGGIPE